MQTVIVPINFAEPSLNALNWAADFLAGSYGGKLILYHAYGRDADAAKATSMLEGLKQKVFERHPMNIEIVAHHAENFQEGLEKVIRHRSANLVVMAITARSALEQFFYNSNAIRISRTGLCPVLVVPEQAKFTGLSNVMLASDFKDTYNTTPSQPIKDFLQVQRPKLHIVNVNKEHFISLSATAQKEKAQLANMFLGFDPEFYFMRLFDTKEAIDLFARDQKIDLIILMERQQPILRKLFGARSTTSTMAYHSRLPLFIVHQ